MKLIATIRPRILFSITAPALLAISLASVPACDVEEDDIALDEGDAAARERHEGGEPFIAMPDAGHDPSQAPAGHGGTDVRSNVPDASPIDDRETVPSTTHATDPTDSTDPPHTHPPMNPEVDLDMDAGDDGGDDRDSDELIDPNDPCDNGHFRCIPVHFDVTQDLFNPAAMPSAQVDLDGYTLKATGANGSLDMDLPVDRSFHFIGSQPGYWNADILVKLPGNLTSLNSSFNVFSDEMIEYFFGLAGQNVDSTSKGMVMVFFSTSVLGEGALLNLPSSPGVVATKDWVATESNTLLADSLAIVNFANVEPGLLTPTLIAPPGYACVLGPEPAAPYEVSVRTVTSVSTYCYPTSP